jgi:hypothetical protein
MTSVQIHAPRVYVGTYGKYNRGSIAGKWIDLSQFKTYQEFIQECQRIHKDEMDPEFMIQDCEYFPDGLSCMEWLSEKDFNDVMAAFHEEKQAELSPEPSKGKNMTEPSEKKYTEWLDEYLTLRGCPANKRYHVGAVKFNGCFYAYGKPSIENKFCWADEGPEYDEYLAVTSNDKLLADYFVKKNLRNINHRIDVFKDKTQVVYIKKDDRSHSFYFYTPYWGGRPDSEDDILIPDDLREIFIHFFEWIKANFEKRLKTYLKRYGVSKLHTWTYWRDA